MLSSLQPIQNQLICGTNLECKSTSQGLNYTGKLSCTASNYQCMMWNMTDMRNKFFPDENVQEAKNYCRNPDKDSAGPWCYTTQSGVLWERCDIPECNPRPQYTGTISETFGGRTCQKWSSQSPHKHTTGSRNIDFPGENVESAKNYCRNPDNYAGGPWCFTTDPDKRTESCLIPGFSKGRQTTVLYSAALAIRMYIYPIMILLGTLMNSLSICVFTRRSLRQSTTAFLLIILAISDTLALYTGTVYRWLNDVTVISWTDISCRIYFYFGYIISSCPGWILVCVSLDRFLNMFIPHNAGQISTIKNAIILLSSLIICLCVSYIPVLMFKKSAYQMLSTNGIVYVNAACQYTGLSITWIHLFLHSLLPFSLMLIGNIIIIYLIFKTIQKRKNFQRQGKDLSELDKLISLGILLMFTTFTYLILTMPYLMYLIMNFMFGDYFDQHYESYSEAWSASQLFLVCSLGFEYINNCLNFLLYCIGSTPFRKEFLQMTGINKIHCFRHSNAVHPAPQVLPPVNPPAPEQPPPTVNPQPSLAAVQPQPDSN